MSFRGIKHFYNFHSLTKFQRKIEAQNSALKYYKVCPRWMLAFLWNPATTFFLRVKARSQHCWPTRRNIVGPTWCERLHTMLCVVACCCDLLQLVGWSLKLVKLHPTPSNKSQQHATTHNMVCNMLATCWAQQYDVLLANNVASVCTGLKRLLSQKLEIVYTRAASDFLRYVL